MFISIIDKLLKEKGVTVTKMLEECKIGKNQYTYWKKNGNVPSGAILQKLADYFGVSVDYLFGKTDKKEKSLSAKAERLAVSLANDPRKLALAEKLLSLSDEELDKVISFAEFLLQKQ